MKHPQHIVAIRASDVKVDEPHGMYPHEIHAGDLIIAQRAWLEQDPTYRQIIPYYVMTHGNNVGVYRRKPGVGEDRLSGKVAIGFGGHVDLADVWFDPQSSVVDLEKTIARSAHREIDEELDLNGNELAGISALAGKLIYSGGVSGVHIGLPFLCPIATPVISTLEPELEWLGFMHPEDVLNEYGEQCELWTYELCKCLVEASQQASA